MICTQMNFKGNWSQAYISMFASFLFQELFYFLTSLKLSERSISLKKLYTGKILWHDWTECTKTCGRGIKLRHAKACIPSYAICRDLPIKQENCNEQACFYDTHSETPPGTIISWIPKPNDNFASQMPIPEKWILCDGVQKCLTGIFANETCSDLSNRALIGTGKIIKYIKIKKFQIIISSLSIVNN